MIYEYMASRFCAYCIRKAQAFCLKRGKNFNATDNDFQKMKFVVKAALSTAVKTAAVIGIAYLLGLHWQILFFMGALLSIRMFARGIHLNSNRACTAIGCVYFFSTPLIAAAMPHNTYVYTAAFIVILVLNLIYAPSPTAKRPIKARRRKWLKIFSAAVIILFYVLSFYMPLTVTYKNLLLLALLLSTATILPVTKKIILFTEKENKK